MSASSSTLPPASPSRKKRAPQTPPASPSSRLAINFNGRVYRSVSHQTGLSPANNFFGQPDEAISEVKRKEVERAMLKVKSVESPSPSRRRAEKAKEVPIDAKVEMERMLGIYAALESAILAHLAEAGSAFAAALGGESLEVVKIPNIIDFTKLKRLIESGGKRFGTRELAELGWIWRGCRIEDDEEFEFLERDQNSGGWTIGTGRILKEGKVVPTYSLGITLEIKHHFYTPSISIESTNLVQEVGAPRTRNGMSLVALWSQSSTSRKALVAQQLSKHFQFHPSTPIGMIELPSLVLAQPLPTPNPTPTKLSDPIELEKAGNGVRGLEKMGDLLAGTKPVLVAQTPAQRRQAMQDRIKAKSAPSTLAILSSPSLGSPSSPKKSLKRSRKEVESEKMEFMKLRSMLSRMGGVVDIVWSLYNLSPMRKIILESEVIEVIAKSSRVALSHCESKQALSLLLQHAPNFLIRKEIVIGVGRTENWCAFITPSFGGVEAGEVKQVFKRELARGE